MNNQLIILALCWILACKPAVQEEQVPSSSETEIPLAVPADFEDFYERFHSDTNFQIDHIVFPLSGLPANADTLSAGTKFKWEKDHWRWHRPIDPTLTGYEREWQILSPDMITERITQRTAGFGMMRRFAKMDDQWMLIYYMAMNPVK